MYRIFTRLYPKVLRKKIENLILCSDIKIKEEVFTGFMFFSSLCLGLFLSLVVSIIRRVTFNFLIFIGLFLVFHFALYFMVVLKADKKARFVESVLPDCLQLTASNLRAGFTTERAFLLSARPEFGSFAEELALLAKKIAGGKTLEEAMLDMTKVIKSEKFQKTIQLIIRGVRSGGELASLLSQTAKNLRNEEIIEAKIRASVFMYFIFIFAAICFAAPLVFGLSSFLVEIISKQLAAIEIPTGIPSPIKIAPPQITTTFILYFIIAVLTTLCIFGSLNLGVIKKGEIKAGITYIPILLACSMGIFFLVRTIIKNVFAFILF